MRAPFATSVLSRLLTKGVLARTDRVLAVCAGKAERDLFLNCGFNNVTISNLDERMTPEQHAPFASSRENAMSLSFADQSFDFAFVADGLHHCSSPHRGLLEMYRVASKGVIVIESRDSLLVRVAARLGMATDYEVAATQYHRGMYGGVDNSGIPNYVYRWTEREFEKTINSSNPVGPHQFLYMYGFNTPDPGSSGNVLKRGVSALQPFLSRAMPVVAPKQCNTFAMVAMRPLLPDGMWSWLRMADGRPRLRTPDRSA